MVLLLLSVLLSAVAALATGPASPAGGVVGPGSARLLRRGCWWSGEKHSQGRAAQAFAISQKALCLLVGAAGQSSSGVHGEHRSTHGFRQGATLRASGYRHRRQSLSRHGRGGQILSQSGYATTTTTTIYTTTTTGDTNMFRYIPLVLFPVVSLLFFFFYYYYYFYYFS